MIRRLENMICEERSQEMGLFSLEKIRQRRQNSLKIRKRLLQRDTLISMFMADRKNKQTNLNYTNNLGKSDLKKSYCSTDTDRTG